MRETCTTKDPQWFLVRSKRTPGKWVCVFYCPGGSSVRSRMVYASSTNDLKLGFGSSMFVNDYHATDISEVSYAEYLSTMADYDPRDLMTCDELDRMDGEIASHMAIGGSKMAVVVGINMASTEGLDEAIAAVGQGGPNTVVIKINTKKETLLLQSHEDLDMEGVTSKMGSSPLFIIHNFTYTHEDVEKKKMLFIYYCAPDAKARVKMIYSSTKSTVVSRCGAQGLSDMRNFELSDPCELTHDYVVDDLHPPVVVVKTVVKPKSKGRGKRRLMGGAKFKAN